MALSAANWDPPSIPAGFGFSNEPTTVSVVNVRANKNKKEDSAAQLPDEKKPPPRTLRRERDDLPELQQSFNLQTGKWNIMKQLVEAAINMHSKGVFHRDIKSENILIETGSNVPRVRIIDFGCGCIVKKRPYRCFSGTPAYGPPEFQISGSYEAGPTTVWQLGALLYEMLDGYKRFNTSKFIRKKIKFNSEMSRDCRGLLRMCLALNPTERATLEQMQLHPWFT
ncbi:serine/threonine-protein kinase pim-2-like [Xiphias gladius]|uniref:serine/threonine-protein kinase pim-2-like n=1 Tax=Xiphias gladius TaxID=8245 RepID=UPI001A99FA15|nr:serine/threonine-protein kinase pim-2-like [Xiphias gladius]